MKKKGFFDKSDLRFVGGNIGLAIVIGLVILTILILWLRGYTQHGKEVSVHDVTGMTISEAQPVLASQGLRMEVIDSTYSDKVPFGTIVEQDPKPNSHAKEGRQVYVTVNATTRRQVIVPDLQDMSSRQAEATLRSLGLKVDTAFEYRPSEYRDLVLDVKSGGESVLPGTKLAQGTRIKLVVGKGRGTAQVSVPNVIGLTLQEARSVILTRRLTLGAVQQDEKPTEGVTQYVYRQSPGAGEWLIEGQTVAIYLSKDKTKAVTSAGSEQHDDDEWF